MSYKEKLKVNFMFLFRVQKDELGEKKNVLCNSLRFDGEKCAAIIINDLKMNEMGEKRLNCRVLLCVLSPQQCSSAEKNKTLDDAGDKDRVDAES